MLGIITARVISKGRYGRTREIRLSTPANEIIKILKEDDTVNPLIFCGGKGQTRLI